MSGPMHFVDITGTLQELGPGAHIQFNGRDGTRQEIVLIGRADLDNTLQTIRDLEQARQLLLQRESELRSELSKAQSAGYTAHSAVEQLDSRTVSLGQALSDRLDALHQSIDAVESQILAKITCVWNTLGPTSSLSASNADVLEVVARKLTQVVASLTTLEDVDAEASERILGLDNEIPNVWASIDDLKDLVGTNDRWAISRTQSLYDRTIDVENVLIKRCISLRKLAISGIAVAIISTIISVIAIIV